MNNIVVTVAVEPTDEESIERAREKEEFKMLKELAKKTKAAEKNMAHRQQQSKCKFLLITPRTLEVFYQVYFSSHILHYF